MVTVAPPPRPDLEDAFWSRFNAWQFVQADPPEAGKKPDWKAVKHYPIAQRAARRGKLIAMRPKAYTNLLVVDLDAGGRYHPHQNPYALAQLQQALEERLGLAECIVLRSSDSGGIHLWYWFETEQNAYHLAEAAAIACKDSGFVPQPGHLEFFPNCKTWIDSDNPDDWSQYHAIRLPLQEPGSYLLDPRNDYRRLLHPFADQCQEFLRLITHCQCRNDLTRDRLEAVLATRPQPFKRVSVTGNKYLHDLLAKVRDGWTGHGQTNQLLFDVTRLLRIFGHFLLGVTPFWETERLATAMHDYILDLPGREQFCGHNHELEKIVWEWATWVQKTKYKPYSYGKKPLEDAQSLDQATQLTHNQQLQQTARERIISAIICLLEQGTLPAAISARIAALEALGIKRGTLYRHRDLWHPESLSNSPESLSAKEFTPPSEVKPLPTGLKPIQQGQFTPISTKELPPRSAAPSKQAQGIFESANPAFAESKCQSRSTQPQQHSPRQARTEERREHHRQKLQAWANSDDPILRNEARFCLYPEPLEPSTPEAGGAEVLPLATPNEDVTSAGVSEPPDLLQRQLSETCPEVVYSESPEAIAYESTDLSELLAEISVHIERLGLTREAVKAHCLTQFRRPRCTLSEPELRLWLNALRRQT